MKKLFLIFTLFLTQISALKAQFVTLSDPNLTWVLMNIYPDCFDANEDLDTTCAALKTGSLDISNNGISDLTGIRYFKLLNNLNCSNNNLTSLPVLPNGLTKLDCSDNQFTSINNLNSSLNNLNINNTGITNMPNLPIGLDTLYCSYNQITSFNTLPNNLKFLDITSNPLTCYPILPNSIQDLYLNSSACLANMPTSILNYFVDYISYNPALEVVYPVGYCNNPNLVSINSDLVYSLVQKGLNITTCLEDKLDTLLAAQVNGYLDIYFYNLDTLHEIKYFKSLDSLSTKNCIIPKFPDSLQYYLCYETPTTSLFPLPNTLKHLDLSNYNAFTSLPSLPNGLEYLNCSGNLITSFPTMPNSLRYLDCSYNQISSFPNFSSNLDSLFIYGNLFSSIPTLPNNLKTLNCTENLELKCLGAIPPNLQKLYIGDSIICLDSKPASIIDFYSETNWSFANFPISPLSNCGGYVYIADSALRTDGGLSCQNPINNALLDTVCASLETSLYFYDSHIQSFETIKYYKSLEILHIIENRNNFSFPLLPHSIKEINILGDQIGNQSVGNPIVFPNLPDSLTLLELTFLNNVVLPPFPNKLNKVLLINNDSLTITSFSNSVKYLEYSDSYNGVLPQLSNTLDSLMFNFNENVKLTSFPNSLTYMSLVYNGLDTIPTLPSSLTYLDCNDNKLTSLPSLPIGLKYLDCSYNSISCSPILPPNLEYLNFPSSIYCLPNKPTSITTFQLDYSPINYSNFPVCSVMPCNTTYGYVFHDINSNGIKDFNENTLKNVQVSAQYSSNQVVSDTTGFLIRSDAGNIDFQITPPLYFTTTTPNPLNHNVLTTQIDTIYFGVKEISGIKDLEVTYSPFNFARPGFTRASTITYKNLGTDSITNVTIKLLNSFQNVFKTASITPNLISNDTLIWNIGTLQPFQSGQITVYDSLSVLSVLGDSFLVQLWAEPILGDSNSINNYFASKQVIVGSFDPNDKTVSPEVQLPTDNQPFDYTIRFQNTGTFPAEFVIVKDTFHSNLDLSTFQMISASHPYHLEIINRVAHWTFNNINLADSFSNEPASHGYIRFKVKPIANLPLGTQIPNSAGIYFDYNAPVITNISIAKIDILNTIWDKKLTSKVSVFPNPTSGLLQVQVEGSKIGEMKLINNLGQIVYQEIVNQENTTLDLTNYPEGVYLLKGLGWSAKIVKE